LKAPFHLYVPMGSVDVARRLAADNNITLAEVFSFHQVGDLVASRRCTGPARPSGCRTIRQGRRSQQDGGKALRPRQPKL
jgi:hypothetical protein